MNNDELFRDSQRKQDDLGRKIEKAGEKQLKELSVHWKELQKNLNKKMSEVSKPKKP